MKKTFISFFIIISLIIMFQGMIQAGPISKLYLVAGRNQTGFTIQGSNVLDTWALPHSYEYPIAVNNSIKVMGDSASYNGSEYDLDGNRLGTLDTSSSHPEGAVLYDGTTDGTYNYGLDYRYSNVYRYDLNWQNPELLFSISTGTNDYLGITYDPTNNSLWISGFYDTVSKHIGNYSMDGTLLSSFQSQTSYNGCLALDHADNTLWVFDRDGTDTFYQYSKTGTLLSTEYYSSIANYNILGGEFELPVNLSTAGIVPEPSSLMLYSIIAVFFFMYRKK